jgi:hypothetical protein
MIVRKDQGTRIALQRQLDDDARVDVDAIDRTLRQHIEGDDAVVAIEPHGVKFFVQQPREAHTQETLRLPRTAETAAALQATQQNRLGPCDDRILASTTRGVRIGWQLLREQGWRIDIAAVIAAILRDGDVLVSG